MSPGLVTWRSLVLLLLYGAAISGQVTTTANPAADDAACRTRYLAQKYKEAADCFAVVAARAADRPEQAAAALLWQGKSLMHAGEPQGAEQALRASATASLRTAETLYLLGHLLQQRNQPRDSLNFYTRAAALQPPTGAQLRIVALDYVLLGSYQDALHWLQRAVALSANDAEAWYDLGRVQMHEGRFTEAVAALKASLKIQPGSAKAEDNLGVCLEAQNQPDAAAAAYARAVSLAEADPHAGEQPFVDYGKLLNNRNAFERALPLLQRATELNQKNSAAFAELSRAYTGTHDPDAARRAMEQAVTLDPENSRLHFQLGRLYRAGGMAQQAQREFELSSKLYGQKSSE